MADLNLMAIFARVVEAGSFAEAARRMGTSRSAVSKAVAKLEKSLGAHLLNRTTRYLSLTEIGASVAEHPAEPATHPDLAAPPHTVGIFPPIGEDRVPVGPCNFFLHNPGQAAGREVGVPGEEGVRGPHDRATLLHNTVKDDRRWCEP